MMFNETFADKQLSLDQCCDNYHRTEKEIAKSIKPVVPFEECLKLFVNLFIYFF